MLEQAVKEAGATPLVAVAQRNLTIAYFKRAMAKHARSEAGRRGASTTWLQAAKAPRGRLNAKEMAAVAAARRSRR